MIDRILPIDIWENEICKFMSIKDIVNFSLCSKKCNNLSIEMLNNSRDQSIKFSYETYITNKHKIDSIKNIKKNIVLDIWKSGEYVLDCINEDVNSLFITLYSKMDLIDFSKCKNIKELYIRSINLNEISILGNFNFNRLETLFMSNINILGYDNRIFRNIKYLELENCIGLNNFESDIVFTSLETLCLRFMRVDSINNIKSLKNIELECVINTTLLYNLPNITYLKCVSCSLNNLENVTSLEVIHLNYCVNINNIECLYNLKTLYINRCSRIKSIKKLKKLENINICNWNGEI